MAPPTSTPSTTSTEATSHVRQPNAFQRFGELIATHRVLIAVLAGVALLLGVAFPFAIAYDDRVDTQRSGYNDAAAVVRLQQALIGDHKEPVAFTVSAGQSHRIGDETFTASEGTTVEVTTKDGGYCVRVTTASPDIDDWTYDSLDATQEYDEKPNGACGP